MTNKQKDGGSAFPYDISMIEHGATLRDIFALAALQGLTSTGDGPYFGTNEKPYNPWDWYAKEAYRAADAMLIERERKKP